MTGTFRERLKARERLFGTMQTLPSAAVAEILAAQGFDWLFIDGEHGPLETNDIADILRAVAGRAACLVRVPQGDEVSIKRVLDLGADGIIVPQVNSPEQAREVVSFARYAPEGRRGIGLARAHGYGDRFAEYLANANSEVSIVVQCEHIDAVNTIDSIVDVSGIDAILLGPYDLSASLGKLGQVDDPEVVRAIERVIDVCTEAKMPLGYFGVTAEAVAPFVERGCSLIVAGIDTLFLGQGARDVLAGMKG